MASLTHEDIKQYLNQGYTKLIETGTYVGDTVANLADYFKEVHSVELNAFFMFQAQQKTSGKTNVFLNFGDSPQYLEKVCPNNDHKTIFFLDSHYSGGITAKWMEDCPLLDELEVIVEKNKREALIIIDDVNLFGTNSGEDWSHISQEAILQVVQSRLISWSIHNNRMFIEITENGNNN